MAFAPSVREDGRGRHRYGKTDHSRHPGSRWLLFGRSSRASALTSSRMNELLNGLGFAADLARDAKLPMACTLAEPRLPVTTATTALPRTA